MKRVALILASLLVVGGPALGTSSSARTGPCVKRLLVLSAYPAEVDKLLTQTTISDLVMIDDRPFFVGRLRGNDVVVALAGIGLVNAEHTTQAAFDHFTCGSETAIEGVVFSGVAGGRSFIGDVTIPSRWTEDDGKTWIPADPEMLAVANGIAASVQLEDRVPLGDPLCIGLDPDLVRTIRMPHHPVIISGGDGKSADPFGGRAFPCIPGGGNIFGCRPCRAPKNAPPDVVRFLQGALPFVDPAFFLDYFQNPTPSSTPYDAEDMETAAVARVAAAHGVPWIGFRAMSDGNGDPLHLPGFPFQFFLYQQLAADNAGTVALAFLEAWATH